jgi:hypothetical protein
MAEPAEFLNRVVDFNGEPRIRDLDLGEWLDYALTREREIRRLIQRNLTEVKRYGLCVTITQSSGGRPSTEYWLNKPQALCICVLSETPKAAEVREFLIKLFLAWEKGKIVSTSLQQTVEINELQERAQTNVLLTKLVTSVEYIRDGVDRIDKNTNHPRKKVLKHVVELHIQELILRHNSKCLLCGKRILDEKGRPISWEMTPDGPRRVFSIDHFHGHERREFEDTMADCFVCNQRREWDTAFDARAREIFKAYHTLAKGPMPKPMIPREQKKFEF